MNIGLEVVSFKDYKSIVKRMKMCGVNYFLISFDSAMNLKNLTPSFLEKALGIKSNKIDDLYSYYVYQECEIFSKDRKITKLLNTNFSYNTDFNIWLTKLLLLQIKSIYKYLKYKNIFFILLLNDSTKEFNVMNKYCDYLYEYKSKYIIDKKGKPFLKTLFYKNINMIINENALYIIDYQIFNQFSIEDMESLYLISCK